MTHTATTDATRTPYSPILSDLYTRKEAEAHRVQTEAHLQAAAMQRQQQEAAIRQQAQARRQAESAAKWQAEHIRQQQRR